MISISAAIEIEMKAAVLQLNAAEDGKTYVNCASLFQPLKSSEKSHTFTLPLKK